MYDIKALYEAESVRDAVRLRLEYPEAQVIAGGSDVLEVEVLLQESNGEIQFGLGEIMGIFQ